MSSAPTLPALAAGTILSGGGAGAFSEDCANTLIDAGFDPGWFGSYRHVATQIRAAYRRLEDYYLPTLRAYRTPPPTQPSDADCFLAACQSGHLTQNQMFQRQRGNACQNERPDPAAGSRGTDGYIDALAPCGPHCGDQQRGMTHRAVTERENQTYDGRQAGDRLTGRLIRAAVRDCGRIAVQGPPPIRRAGLAQNAYSAAVTQRHLTQDLQRRSRTALRQQRRQDPAGPPSVLPPQVRNTRGGDCIAAFQARGMEAMRRAVMERYGGSPSQFRALGRQQRAELAEARSAEATTRTARDTARAELAQAEARLRHSRQQPNASAAALRERRRERGEARVRCVDAERAHDDARLRREVAQTDCQQRRCLRRQALRLQAHAAANNGALPPLEGSVPRGSGGARRLYRYPNGSSTTTAPRRPR